MGIYNFIMKKVSEQTYTIKEIQENMDRYLNLSSNRLRTRLKSAWKKQVTARQLTYAGAKI